MPPQVVEEDRQLVLVQLLQGLRVVLGHQLQLHLRARRLDHVVDVPVVVRPQVARVRDFVQNLLDLLQLALAHPLVLLVDQEHLVRAPLPRFVRNARVPELPRRRREDLLVVRVVVS